MTALRLIDTDVVDADILAGPETFEAPMITVVDGLKIESHAPQAVAIAGCATLFRLGGEDFGTMYELNDLREIDGRTLGRCKEPVEVGALVTIGWEADSRCACRGVVAFCRRIDDGWLVTLDVDAALAA